MGDIHFMLNGQAFEYLTTCWVLPTLRAGLFDQIEETSARRVGIAVSTRKRNFVMVLTIFLRKEFELFIYSFVCLFLKN